MNLVCGPFAFSPWPYSGNLPEITEKKPMASR